MGRLRQPGTCTIFTTYSDLQTLSNGDNRYAREMAQLLLNHRHPERFKDAMSSILDTDACLPLASQIPGTEEQPHFRFEVFQTYCHGLQAHVAELSQAGSCTFCVLLGKQDLKNHKNKDCPIAKSSCNKCYQQGHVRCVRIWSRNYMHQMHIPV